MITPFSLMGSEGALSQSVFEMIMNGNFEKNWGGDSEIFKFFLISLPIVFIIIALTEKYELLFIINTGFLISTYSTIQQLYVAFQSGNLTIFKLGFAWAFFIIPSVVMLVMGGIHIGKSDKFKKMINW